MKDDFTRYIKGTCHIKSEFDKELHIFCKLFLLQHLLCYAAAKV